MQIGINKSISKVLTFGLIVSVALILLATVSKNLHLAKWGLYILLLTPVARLIVASFKFSKSKDKLFAVITAITAVSIVISALINYHF